MRSKIILLDSTICTVQDQYYAQKSNSSRSNFRNTYQNGNICDAVRIIQKSRERILNKSNSLKDSEYKIPIKIKENTPDTPSKTIILSTEASSNSKHSSGRMQMSPLRKILKEFSSGKDLKNNDSKLVISLKKMILARRKKLMENTEIIKNLEQQFTQILENSQISPKNSMFQYESPKIERKVKKCNKNIEDTVKIPTKSLLRPITTFQRNYQKILKYDTLKENVFLNKANKNDNKIKQKSRTMRKIN